VGEWVGEWVGDCAFVRSSRVMQHLCMQLTKRHFKATPDKSQSAEQKEWPRECCWTHTRCTQNIRREETATGVQDKAWLFDCIHAYSTHHACNDCAHAAGGATTIKTTQGAHCHLRAVCTGDKTVDTEEA
jgi:hypothetical protein